MNEKKTQKKRKRKINRILTIILFLVTLIFLSLILYINIIPLFYTILFIILILGILFGIMILNFKKKRILRIIGYTLSIFIISVMIFILIYLFNTLGVLFNMTDGSYSLHNYNLIVLNDSKYKDLLDLKNKNIGININTDEEKLTKVKKEINKKVLVNYEEYKDLDELLNDFLDKELDGIILEDSEISLVKENKEVNNLFKVLFEVEVKKTLKELRSAININKEPFNIYISGIDTFGSINSTSRSDVNIVVTVNPKTEKILITWIPRDYYVKINDKKDKDKLTHTGIYGLDKSIFAIENLLNIDTNYYVKVNFTSIIEVVDVLGGITVYNDNEFTTDAGKTFKQGNINLNGEDTLTFVRERKNLAEGDLGRGKNQIKVLEALLNKAMSKDIIKNYNNLLKSLEDTFVTNMSKNEMVSFIRKEITKRRNWQIESNTLIGTDSYEYTYSYKNSKLYVMVPNEESVNNAKSKIAEIMNVKN